MYRKEASVVEGDIKVAIEEDVRRNPVNTSSLGLTRVSFVEETTGRENMFHNSLTK